MNDAEVMLSELGGHLRRKDADVYSLSPRRFEELVEDVFKRNGMRTVLTSQTRDGGADIVILHRESDAAFAIVECKRYAPDRKIGVDLVRYIVGAAVLWNVRKAYLVTSSSFSSVALAGASAYRTRGFELDLIAMADLAMLMHVYNAELPALNYLTEDERRQIAQASREELLDRYKRKDSPFEERVSLKAYDFYLQRRRHGVSGSAQDDWLRAEAYVRQEDSGEFGIPMA